MDRDEGPIGRLFGGNDEGDEGDEDEWRFSVSEVGPDAADAADVDDVDDADGPERPPLEPGSVTPEHAAFVLVGAALTLVVISTAL